MRSERPAAGKAALGKTLLQTQVFGLLTSHKSSILKALQHAKRFSGSTVVDFVAARFNTVQRRGKP